MTDYLEQFGLQRKVVEVRINLLTHQAASYRSHASKSDTADPWRRIASYGAAGTCAMQAASLAMLAENDSRDPLLVLAANDYINANLPFGFLLQTLHRTDSEIEDLLFASPVGRWLSALDGEKDDRRKPESKIPDSLSAIDQQLYLLMTLTSAESVTREFRDPLKRLIKRLRTHPNVPHGPQGQPIAVYLDIFEAIVDAGLEHDPSRAVHALRRLVTHYAESIESARRNEYLWVNLWSPVDYLDLEIVVAARCLARTFEVEVNGIELQGIAAVPLLLANQANRQRPIQFR